MATFRQQQIEEILNYDRSMNRIVLDNEIGQATRFNDERNPPTNRDIKFEALLGTLIDDLKAKIAEALQSIASKQYPKTDAAKVTTLLGLPTGETKGDFKNMNYAAIKKAQKQQEDYNYAQSKVREAEINGEEDFPEEEDEEEKEKDGPTLQEDITPAPRNNLTAVAPTKNGKGKPSKRRRFMMGGAEGDEAAEGTRAGAEAEKSQRQQANATENVLYDIINKYNGIVDKLLQATQPDGRFASKRTVSQSSISYFSDVLKGLLEPLRHLVFELSQVHNPALASVINMMTSMIDIIDISPPFQKVNVLAYKSGMPDFQGMNSSTQLLNVDGYIADLKKYKERMTEIYTQLKHQSTSMLFNIPNERLRKSLMDNVEERKKQYKQVIKDMDEEIKQVTARKRITEDFEANGQLIKAAESVYESMEQLLQDGEPERQEIIRADPDKSTELLKLPNESYEEFLLRLKDSKIKSENTLKKLEKWKHDHQLEDGDDEELDDLINKERKLIGEFDSDIKTYEEAVEYNGMTEAFFTEEDIPEGFEMHPETKRVKSTRENRRGMLEADLEANMQEANREIKELKEKEEAAKKVRREKKLKNQEGMAAADVESSAENKRRNRLEKYKEINDEIDKADFYTIAKIVKRERAPGDLPIKGKKKEQLVAELKEYITKKYTGKGGPVGRGGSGGLATLLSTGRKPQYWHHRELSNDDDIHREVVQSNKKWQATSNPPHTTPVGTLYPFYKKDKASLYSFPLKLKHDLAKIKPDDTQKDTRGADISLLQGPIGETEPDDKYPPRRKAVVTHRTAKQAMDNILQGRGMETGRCVGAGKKKNPKALHKILFDDEGNDMFDDEYEHPEGGGMIEEESEEDEDRFRNKKLGPKKKKSVKK